MRLGVSGPRPRARRRLVTALGAGAVLVALAVWGTTTQLTSGGSHSATTSRPGTGGSAAALAAARWAEANLPSGTTIVAPRALAGRLAGLRLSTSCPSSGYLLVDGGSGPGPECLANSLPVARFDRGTEIRQLISNRLAAARARSRAVQDRRRAGAALAANPSITLPNSARRLVRAGRLDLRVLTVLAALAGREPVHVVAVVGDPAELAAGLPARTVEVSDPPAARLAPLLRLVARDYRPAVTRLAGGAVRLRWPFRVTPPPVLR